MRLLSCLLIVMFFASSTTFAQKFVQPKRASVGLYANEKRGVNEQAVKTLGVDDRLKVLSTKRNHYFVQMDDGTKGWVEKRLCAAASGKSFMFDDAEVIGYLDSPTPVYIIDADSKDATPIKLDRSFAEALRENVDRETVERQQQ